MAESLLFILDNAFQTIEYDTQNDIIYNKWKPSTEQMTTEEYKTHLTLLLREGDTRHTKYVLSDATEMKFMILPELQIWGAIAIAESIERNGNFKKCAIIQSVDIFVQVGLQQMMEEEQANVTPFQIQYFNDMEKAKIWILK